MNGLLKLYYPSHVESILNDILKDQKNRNLTFGVASSGFIEMMSIVCKMGIMPDTVGAEEKTKRANELSKSLQAISSEILRIENDEDKKDDEALQRMNSLSVEPKQ